jgi:hypothetical protein
MASETAAGATANNNVAGGAATIYTLEVDNTGNGSAVYLKIYQNAAPVVGNTAPDAIIMAPGSTKVSMGFTSGWYFSILSFACVTQGGNGGTTAPTNPVPVKILYS